MIDFIKKKKHSLKKQSTIIQANQKQKKVNMKSRPSYYEI
jgi:hypothetical protein